MHEDPYLGLLNLRNTPVEGINLSLAQLMFGRTKSTLPTTVRNFTPSVPDSATWKKTKEDKRAKIADRLNENRRDLRELEVVKLFVFNHYDQESENGVRRR